MTDILYQDFYELLSIQLERIPTYEEVQERIKKEFTITTDEEMRYHFSKVMEHKETVDQKFLREEREDKAFWRNIRRLGIIIFVCWSIELFFDWL